MSLVHREVMRPQTAIVYHCDGCGAEVETGDIPPAWFQVCQTGRIYREAKQFHACSLNCLPAIAALPEARALEQAQSQAHKLRCIHGSPYDGTCPACGSLPPKADA